MKPEALNLIIEAKLKLESLHNKLKLDVLDGCDFETALVNINKLILLYGFDPEEATRNYLNLTRN